MCHRNVFPGKIRNRFNVLKSLYNTCRHIYLRVIASKFVFPYNNNTRNAREICYFCDILFTANSTRVLYTLKIHFILVYDIIIFTCANTRVFGILSPSPSEILTSLGYKKLITTHRNVYNILNNYNRKIF